MLLDLMILPAFTKLALELVVALAQLEYYSCAYALLLVYLDPCPIGRREVLQVPTEIRVSDFCM